MPESNPIDIHCATANVQQTEVNETAALPSVQAWQIADIKAGLAEADRGEFATEEEVNAVFAKYGA